MRSSIKKYQVEKGKMKPILAILAFITSFSLFGQEKQVENLVNQVYKEIVPNNFEYYNLLDSSTSIRVDKYSFEENETKKFLVKYPDFPVEWFLKSAKEGINWNNYHLEKAKIHTSATIPRFYSQSKVSMLVPFKIPKQKLDSLERNRKYNQAIVPVKKEWNQKRIDKEINKTWARYSNGIRFENKICYYFSKPIISENELYAMITLEQTGSGATYIFKNIGNKWIKVHVLNRWVS